MGMIEEPDEYHELLASVGRTEQQDRRIGIHESGHILAARLLGNPLGGATVEPGPGFEGRVWGEYHMDAFAEGRGDASDVRDALASLMPTPGEDVGAASDVFMDVHRHCIELAAGKAAERIVLGADDERSAADDLRQARELALLICMSEEAVAAFLSYCEVAARDLLLPYGAVLIELSTALRIRRTLKGSEIDALISDVEARMALAKEHIRRGHWRETVERAKTFTNDPMSGGH